MALDGKEEIPLLRIRVVETWFGMALQVHLRAPCPTRFLTSTVFEIEVFMYLQHNRFPKSSAPPAPRPPCRHFLNTFFIRLQENTNADCCCVCR